MAIAVGDKIPDIRVMTSGPDGPTHVQTGEVLGSGKVVLFAVPGAFTPTCSDYHLPSYVLRHDELKAKGVDTVACISVNDPFVMAAWAENQHVGDLVVMLADGNGEFTQAVGLEMDGQRLRPGNQVTALRHGHRGWHRARAERRAGAGPERECRRRHSGSALNVWTRSERRHAARP